MKIVQAKFEETIPYQKGAVEGVVAAPASLVSWHPWVDRVSLFEEKGFLYRRSHIMGGEVELIEKYWKADEADQSVFHFQAVQGLWADLRYRTKIELREAEEGCHITWMGRLVTDSESDEKDQMLSFYKEGIAGLLGFLGDN